MNALRIAVIAGAAVVAFPSALSAQAAEPGECIRRDPQGYCLEWDVTTPGTPGTPGGSGGGPAPECYWVTIDDELPEDPTIFVDFGLEEPPEGVPILWQSWECSDGRATFNFRWVIAPTPGALAETVRGRLIGQLPQPVVESSPPAGTASIIGVPVFVTVVNWTGVVTQTECAGGLCVTVTATPQLTFRPGEPGAPTVQCSAPEATRSPWPAPPPAPEHRNSTPPQRCRD